MVENNLTDRSVIIKSSSDVRPVTLYRCVSFRRWGKLYHTNVINASECVCLFKLIYLTSERICVKLAINIFHDLLTGIVEFKVFSPKCGDFCSGAPIAL